MQLRISNLDFASKISPYICASRAEPNLGVLHFQIGILPQKLVIICATHAGAIIRVLTFKISF